MRFYQCFYNFNYYGEYCFCEKRCQDYIWMLEVYFFFCFGGFGNFFIFIISELWGLELVLTVYCVLVLFVFQRGFWVEMGDLGFEKGLFGLEVSEFYGEQIEVRFESWVGSMVERIGGVVRGLKFIF